MGVGSSLCSVRQSLVIQLEKHNFRFFFKSDSCQNNIVIHNSSNRCNTTAVLLQYRYSSTEYPTEFSCSVYEKTLCIVI